MPAYQQQCCQLKRKMWLKPYCFKVFSNRLLKETEISVAFMQRIKYSNNILALATFKNLEILFAFS